MITIDQGGAGAHAVRVVRPPGELAALVDHFWVDERANVPCPAWRIVPDDAPHIIFSETVMAGQSRYRLVVVGARTIHVDIDRSARVRTLGARLRPGSLPSLLGAPAGVLTDLALPLGDFAPQLARDAIDRLANDASHAVHHLTWMLKAMASVAPRIDSRAAWLSSRPRLGACRIDEMACELGISGRALRSWSGRHLGMSLKRLLRIRRVHGSMLLHRTQSGLSWSQIATRAGYADQAHCTHEFTSLLGEPPSRFAARATTGNVPIPPSEAVDGRIGSLERRQQDGIAG